MPYTAQEIVITGTVTTALGTEDVTLTYTLDVDHESIRLTTTESWALTDQYNKTITGERSTEGESTGKIIFSVDGQRPKWTHRSRYTYKVKMQGSDTWSDALHISARDDASCAIGYIMDIPFEVQVFYDYSDTHEQSSVYYVYTTNPTAHVNDVTLYSENEGVVIDNTAHTVSVTAKASDIIDIFAQLENVTAAPANIYVVFCNSWLATVESGSEYPSPLRTAEDLAGASYVLPVVLDNDGHFIAQGPVYTITVTITE